MRLHQRTLVATATVLALHLAAVEAQANPPQGIIVRTPFPTATDLASTGIATPSQCKDGVLEEVRPEVPHYIVLDTSAVHRNELLIYLPGTGGAPSMAAQFLEAAASAGYHVIGLAYWNKASIEAPCLTGGASCTEIARQEVILGSQPAGTLTACTGYDVSPANGILNRLEQAIGYMAATTTCEGWDQFLAAGKVVWDKVSLSGHSQGAGHAAYIAKKLHTLDRVLMFAGPGDTWDSGGILQPAPWLTPAQGFTTPAEEFFGLIHESDALAGGYCNDPVLGTGHTVEAWGSQGMNLVSGCPEVVQLSPFLEPSLHVLASDLPLNPLQDPPHGVPVKDWSGGPPHVFEDVWEYMGLQRAAVNGLGSQPTSCSSATLKVCGEPTPGETIRIWVENAPAGQLAELWVSPIYESCPSFPVVGTCNIYLKPNAASSLGSVSTTTGTLPCSQMSLPAYTWTVTGQHGQAFRLQAGLYDPATGQIGFTPAVDVWIGYD